MDNNYIEDIIALLGAKLEAEGNDAKVMYNNELRNNAEALARQYPGRADLMRAEVARFAEQGAFRRAGAPQRGLGVEFVNPEVPGGGQRPHSRKKKTRRTKRRKRKTRRRDVRKHRTKHKKYRKRNRKRK